jgi:hypothetical protein
MLFIEGARYIAALQRIYVSPNRRAELARPFSERDTGRFAVKVIEITATRYYKGLQP